MKKFKEFINEKYMTNDSIGYNIGKYIYHVSPLKYLNIIKKNGLIPQNGKTINNKEYKNRLYLATSLIAAYDISVNFESYKEDNEYVIFKINSESLINGYDNDPLFQHGIYIDYPIDEKYILEIINTDDLFNKFDDDDIDNLYL